MTKTYISILDLFPFLIENVKEDFGWRGPFTTPNQHKFHNYVIETSEDNLQQLHFRNFIYELASALDGNESRSNNSESAPYALNHSYKVPYILEVEFLKQSESCQNLSAETFDYIENIFYQYVLLYIRYLDRQQYNENRDLNTSDDIIINPLEDRLFELDTNAEDYISVVKNMVAEKFAALDEIKAMTSSEKNSSFDLLPVARNFDDILYYTRRYKQTISDSYYPSTRYGNGGSSLQMLMPIALLISDFYAQDTQPFTASYNDYMDILDKTPFASEYRINHEEYRCEHQVTWYGQYTNIYYISRSDNWALLDGLYTVQLIEVILNNVARHLYPNGRVVVSAGSVEQFGRENWATDYTPSLVLNAGTLSWEDNTNE